MKLSAGTIGTVLFTAAGIAVFVLMAKRPAIDGNAMNFGMPISPAVAEEKMPEATTPEAASTSAETTATSMPEPEAATAEVPPTAEVEPVKAEETTTIPATLEPSMPASEDTETKAEEIPAAMPIDAPAVDGSTTTN